MVKQYELMVLLPAGFSAEQMKTFVDSISKLIAKNEGKVLSNESLGKRSLAYQIKKQTEAFFVLFTLELDTAVVQAFEREVRLMEDVLRCLLLIIEPKKANSKKKRSVTIEEEKQV